MAHPLPAALQGQRQADALIYRQVGLCSEFQASQDISLEEKKKRKDKNKKNNLRQNSQNGADVGAQETSCSTFRNDAEHLAKANKLKMNCLCLSNALTMVNCLPRENIWRVPMVILNDSAFVVVCVFRKYAYFFIIKAMFVIKKNNKEQIRDQVIILANPNSHT